MEITDLFCSDLLDACSSEIYFEVLEVLQKYFGNSRVRCLYNRLREVAWLDGLNVFYKAVYILLFCLDLLCKCKVPL